MIITPESAGHCNCSFEESTKTALAAARRGDTPRPDDADRQSNDSDSGGGEVIQI